MKGVSMKPGDIVMVYEDPIACQYPEGKAKLLQIVKPAEESQEPKLEYWLVQFLRGYKGIQREHFNRWIKIP